MEIIILAVIGLSMMSVFKDVAAKILFLLSMAVALLGIGYSMSIVVMDVFYFTSYDIERIAMSMAVLIIPVILIKKPIRKEWIRWFLYVLQMVVLYVAVIGIFLYIPRPLSKTAIEKQILVQMPKYKIVKYNFHVYNIYSCNGRQILRLKGDRSEFYRDLDSLSRIDGTGWDKAEEDYKFSVIRMDDEHFDRSECSFEFFSMKVSKTDNKAYIEFWNV